MLLAAAAGALLEPGGACLAVGLASSVLAASAACPPDPVPVPAAWASAARDPVDAAVLLTAVALGSVRSAVGVDSVLGPLTAEAVPVGVAEAPDVAADPEVAGMPAKLVAPDACPCFELSSSSTAGGAGVVGGG